VRSCDPFRIEWIVRLFVGGVRSVVFMAVSLPVNNTGQYTVREETAFHAITVGQSEKHGAPDRVEVRALADDVRWAVGACHAQGPLKAGAGMFTQGPAFPPDDNATIRVHAGCVQILWHCVIISTS